MKNRNFALCALGLAAAITFGGASTASAQARSETRIPVRKDTPVEPMRVDTVRIMVRDTVMMPGRRDTVMMTRYDTTRVQMMPPMQTLSKLFFGLGAGIAGPLNNWRNSTQDGLAAQAHIGYYPGAGRFGIRGAVNANFLDARDTDCPTCPDPKVYSGAADLLLRFPLDRYSKLNPVLYVLGGGGIHKFDNFLAYQTNGRVVTGGADTFAPQAVLAPPRTNGPSIQVTTANRGTKSVFFGYGVGGGLEVDVGPAHLFGEMKYTAINTNLLVGANTTGGGTSNSSQFSHYVPLIIGLNFGW